MLEIGTVIDGKYKILNKIGQGGMSIVYLAINERANKPWAIKEVRKDGVQDFEVVQQGLIAETNILKKLNHPNLPSMIDIIDEEGRLLIVMDYIEGNTLEWTLEEEGAQPQDMVIEWSIQLCDVLGYLHSRVPPIIYRDMKPSNVMLRPDGTVVLFDFGTAREYKAGNDADTACLGTRGYAAPEQYDTARQTDARTDIYCLGATMFHLLTGERPAVGQDYRIRCRNPALSTGLERIILKCTNPSPDERYQTCAQLMYDLEHYQDLDIENTRQRKKKRILFFATSALCLICAGISLGTSLAQKSITANSYDAYMLEGEGSATEEEAAQAYAQAISLAPRQPDAWMELLENVFLADDNLTSEEDQLMRRLLSESGSGDRKNEEIFAENTAAYEEFAYRIGLAYFYSYEGSGNKSMSAKWLRIASESESLETNKVERAGKLSQISEYYSRIGVANKYGDASTGYQDYWNDLKNLVTGNIAQADNVTTAMMVYKELIYQVYNHAADFRADGVSQKELLDELEYVRRHLDSDIVIADDVNRDRNTELKDRLYENLEQARRQVLAVFEARTEGGEN